MNRKRNLEESQNLEKKSQSEDIYSLILHNDDVHDFMYVIDSLIEVCDHDLVQAEQCTYLVHYRGACEIKVGKHEKLKSLYNKLERKGLTVSIN